MKTEQLNTLEELADAVLAGIKECYDHHESDTPNVSVAMMLITIHKQLMSVIQLESK